MLPVAVQLPVAGLYSSAVYPANDEPPATSTWSFCSKVALWPKRRVVMLPVAVQLPVAGLYSSALDNPPLTEVGASRRENLATGEQRSGKAIAARAHAAGRGKLSRSRVVQLGAGNEAAVIVEAPGHQHLTVLQQRRPVAIARSLHTAREGPLARRRVVHLGASEKTSAVVPSCHEHLAVREQRGCMVNACGFHASGFVPGPRSQGWAGRNCYQSDGEQTD